ncbi:hypothetical protein [Paenibacillus aestuarii]|uniref:Uncharacterized protein n=1 Tax=Paenibacillus aestuarii TaxID=516965 RepID=A0ABW0K9N4_9BACL|nr:hypothetical protein [Paenibacillus aestuarii]
MKKVFKSVLVASLLSVSMISSHVFAAEQTNVPVTEEVATTPQNQDIVEKIDEINKKYGIGQEFSKEDSDFIIGNTPTIPKVGSSTSRTFSSVQTDKYYFTGKGYCYD